MSEIVLSTDDLTVLGGPETVNLEVDFGPQGDRGSYIFLSTDGNPNEHAIGQTPNVYDLCINMKSSDDEYLALYQYVNQAGTNVWVKLFKLIPNTYSTNNTGTFASGVREINIPVVNIVPAELLGSVTAANFNIQYNILNDKPIASSMTVEELVTQDDIITLPLTIEALEYSGGSWIELSGSKTVHLLITVI